MQNDVLLMVTGVGSGVCSGWKLVFVAKIPAAREALPYFPTFAPKCELLLEIITLSFKHLHAQAHMHTQTYTHEHEHVSAKAGR